jgi:multidrug efflux pump subunit AcrB
MNDTRPSLGIAGRIARTFLTTEITPLLALVGLLLGVFAVMVTPREEEPQINVTFANVFIPFPGASAKEVEQIVTSPAERLLSEIQGVEHLYSSSMPGMALLTVRFTVGEPRTDAIVRLYNALYSNQDWLPANSGVGPALIKPKGIDDVPIVALTLWSEDAAITGDDLLRVARGLQTPIQRVAGTREIKIIGGPDRVVHIALDAQRLASYGLAIDDLTRALAAANASQDSGSFVDGNREILVQAGTFLTTPEEVADLVVGVKGATPIFLRDVAQVRFEPDQPERYVTTAKGRANGNSNAASRYPAVTIAIAKKPGENAVEVSQAVLQRLDELKGIYLPDNIHVTVTRDYGATAEDKAQTLIKKLIFATLSVVVLVFLALGRRESVVVGAAVIVTLAMTLFASWAWGFTLNRVSLFALIFSIGILVDDAIVVVENIHRHMQLGGKSLSDAIPIAVDEVGGPTILATFTVIAALLPMAFVSGLMGPYMRPIPLNASTGMLISLAIAFMFTPWLYRRLFLKHAEAHGTAHDAAGDPLAHHLQRFFTRIMTPFLRGADGKKNRLILLLALLGLIVVSLGLVGVRAVVMKMLPFDNKSEFQVMVDMPEGTPLEETNRILNTLADYVQTVPEVTDYQIYAGSSAPINFNGLVRQYYLRTEPHQGDIQVNLLEKHLRERKSHEIALSVRGPLSELGRTLGANVKIVEVPPGPPVLSPLVAEIYGLDYSKQIVVAQQVRGVFEKTPDIVDVDDTIEAAQPKRVFSVDRARAAKLGVAQTSAVTAIAAAMHGVDASYLHSDDAQEPIPVRLELPSARKADTDALRALRVRSESGKLVPVSEVTTMKETTRDQTIHHKDLLPVVYVFGDAAGRVDSPLYGMASISSQLNDLSIDNGKRITQSLTKQPDSPHEWNLKWDGEWQITLDTFRDMGLAYSVGLVLIYLLVVAQFRSYSVPLIIMAPIPLTLIGIMPGHALLGQQFTAPSMIGMIALAGIIVRNSILLVDFIEQEMRDGKSLQDATISAAAVRARPIALTAVAAMLGGFFIIDDPIFGGLAVSLIFGLLVSTVLTLVVIPVVFYAYRWQRAELPLKV